MEFERAVYALAAAGRVGRRCHRRGGGGERCRKIWSSRMRRAGKKPCGSAAAAAARARACTFLIIIVYTHTHVCTCIYGIHLLFRIGRRAPAESTGSAHARRTAAAAHESHRVRACFFFFLIFLSTPPRTLFHSLSLLSLPTPTRSISLAISFAPPHAARVHV